MVKPGDAKDAGWWKLMAPKRLRKLRIRVHSGMYDREQVQVLTAEFIEWLGETAEAPKP